MFAMRCYWVGAHTKTDLKVHLVWGPKYRKKALSSVVAIRVKDTLRQIAMEHDLEDIRQGTDRHMCTCLSDTIRARTSGRRYNGSKG